MWGAHEAMGWWMVFGGIFWALFIAAVLYVVWTVAERTPQPRAAGRGRETPQDVARRRYAAGEITEEEYERLRTKLREG